MNFVIYDVVLLILFVIFISLFLYRNRRNLKREGWLYLYKAKWGMRLLERFEKKYQKTLKFLSYVSITIGYLLMVGMLYLFGKIIYLYIAYPSVVRAIKVPPITPLIPYLPQAFKLDFLPPFYFTYWIIVLAVIAITHEFAHGIFMKRYGIKIKSTGFGFFPFFLPVFLAAFVEQDEKSMNKSKRFDQMAVLSAGTFANVLTAILFFIIMFLFFTLAFAPSGVEFNTYSYSFVAIPAISFVNGIGVEEMTYDNLVGMMNPELNEIKTDAKSYVITKDILKQQGSDKGIVALYDDAPAIRVGLEGAIIEIDGVKITGWENFGEEILKYSPGDNITLKTKVGEETQEYEITLGKNPNDAEKPWLGIGFAEQKRSGVIGKVVEVLSSFKKPQIYYEPKFEFAEFIYDFLWWLILISISVALVNMLPMGIFDGGRFFYLTILGLTKSKEKAEKWFKGVTRFLLFLVLVLMFFWVWSWIVG